jgi:hypothetical protein
LGTLIAIAHAREVGFNWSNKPQAMQSLFLHHI